MNHPSVARRLHFALDYIANPNQVLSEGKLLGTIVLTKNLNALSSRLPRSNYRPIDIFKK